MRPQLVIFDCDGVLVDTETIGNDRTAEFLSARGSTWTGAECRKLFQGKTLEDVCLHYTTMNNFPHDPDLPHELRQVIEAAMTSGIEAIPGAVDLVAKITQAGIPLCVASSGSVAKMHKTLGQIGLLDRLRDVLFSAQDVGRGKPHPDVFLAAADAMGHRCEDSVIIEDSVSGVVAGIASGARVLGYCGDLFTDNDALKDAGAELIEHMDEVPSLIGI